MFLLSSSALALGVGAFFANKFSHLGDEVCYNG